MAAPALSVVVPSVNGFDDLSATLGALERQRLDVPLEVLVVDRLGPALREQVRSRFPHVRILEVPSDATIPDMRARAFREATAPSVAVIEDHVIVPDGWAKALLAAQTPSTPVVAGAVENAATERLVDWAAYLCEYSHCTPPLPAGPVEWLTGNNVVYPRELLERYRGVAESGGWENRLHDALKGDGIVLTCRPEIVVGHKMHYTVGLYMSQRYLYSRSYAGARMHGAGVAKRLLMGAASLALPPLLFWRTVSRIRAKGRHTSELVRSLPLIALFVVAWAVGEAVGSVAGAGDSLSRVR
ncbi:MAG TPA: glycosyltransferase [Gemmatimonadaceae bacterium]|nr:glycosyltransferase [Gemmatimonadaceae bacterium]